jgi:uncharacterized SAM-binding protein YcdF (DUF218 family)
MRRLVLLLLLAAGALALVEDARRPVLTAAGRFLVVEDPLAPADVIVVLSGGEGDERVRQAAALYHAGYAPVVVLSGGGAVLGEATAQILRRQALARGIPDRALVYERTSTSTGEQARNLREILARRRVRRAIVVTSSYHTRRTRYLFRRAFADSGIDVRVYPVRHDVFDPDGWWTREQDTERVVLEYIKLALAVVRR